MNDFLTFTYMLAKTRKCANYSVHKYPDGTADITFERDDDWYNVIFYFDSTGKLVSVE